MDEKQVKEDRKKEVVEEREVRREEDKFRIKGKAMYEKNGRGTTKLNRKRRGDRGRGEKGSRSFYLFQIS